MSSLKLPLRYLLLGLPVAGIMLSAACRQDRQVGYRTVPLVQGTRSFGMPLAGIAVDAERHVVYAIVGGSTDEVRKDFRILWKGKEGATYCATISSEGAADSICEIVREGGARELHELPPSPTRFAAGQAQTPITGADETVRSIIDALPASSGFRDTE